jgi:two-component system NarL family sensor kinase
MLKSSKGSTGSLSGRLKPDMTEQALKLQELARWQLARSLHDGPIQNVAALAMRAALASRLMAEDPTTAAKEALKLEDAARQTSKELRYFQFVLRPQALETAGLVPALEDLARHAGELFAQTVHIDAVGKTSFALELPVRDQLFQIAAEAVSNARKHAQASVVTVRLTRPESGVLLMEIEDDGIGFDWPAYESKPREQRGLGLELMRIRANLLSGEFAIDSQQGRGTTVRVATPVR